jgi:hypothetical protein
MKSPSSIRNGRLNVGVSFKKWRCCTSILPKWVGTW